MTIRQRRTRRRGLTTYKVMELLTGQTHYPVVGYDGYGDGHHTDLERFADERMRADYEGHRDALLRFWVGGDWSVTEAFEEAGLPVKGSPFLFYCGEPGTRPWAWWRFEAPEPLPEGEEESDYLKRHGLLLDGELEELRRARKGAA